MELRQLEHFVAVAEEGSFTRAARRLGYVQSAISVSVASIERELSVRLFDRTTHRVQLTDAGRQLLPSARATLAGAAAMRTQANAVNGVLSGTLRIGIMQAFAFLDIAPLLGRFHREHPGVEIAMRPASGGSAEMLRWVAGGDLDVAFVAAVDRPANVTLQTLGRESLEFATAADEAEGPEAPVTLEQLAGESFIDFPTGWGVRAAADRAFQERGLHRDVRIEVADVETLVALVEHGLGVALLPRSLTPQDRHTLRRHPITPPVSWEIALATRSDHAPSAAAAAFLAMVPAVSITPEAGPLGGS